MRLGAEAGGKIPGEAFEAGGAAPGAGMAVHSRSRFAEDRKAGAKVVGLGRLDSGLPVEHHDVARSRQARMGDRLDQGSVGGCDRPRRDGRSVIPQRAHPGEFRGDRVQRMVSVAMHPQGVASAALGIFHPVGRILRDIDEDGRRAAGDAVAGEGGPGHLGDVREQGFRRQIVDPSG